MPDHVNPPQAIRADIDPDPRSPREPADAHAAILDEQPIAQEIEPVLRERDPHRHRQIPGTATEIVIRRLAPGAKRPALHGPRGRASGLLGF